MNWREYLKGKKITIIGLGLNGGALNDAKFLSKHGAVLTVTDIKTAEQLAPSVEALKDFPNIKFVLGEHHLEDFQTADLVLQPGNVPLNSPYFEEARKNNIPIFVSESLFAYLAPEVELVGVTGTRGKSTVTQLIYEILKLDYERGLNRATCGAVGQNGSSRKPFLGGNVRNVSTLALLEEVAAGDLVVMELDSWALRGLGDIKKSPNLAVFTNLLIDHLNFYKGSMELYLHDKAQIFIHQMEQDTVVLGQQVEATIKEKYGDQIKSKIIVAEPDLPVEWQINLPGAHNRYNVSLAVTATRELGVSEEKIKEAVENFQGLPGRLEYLGEKDGITYYNDNNATTPDGTIAAVKAFPNFKGKIILIGGGADKELDFTEYGQIVPDYVKKFILFEGPATEKIISAIDAYPRGLASWVRVDSMAVAFSEAQNVAETGDMILLSPAAASFGVFRNEYERNDQFVSLVKNI
ncbi:MAG: UDP-N-acetylmuramoyl-L-alanine--D-glutamate ligase [Patescibacteria group bacterium]